MYGRRGQRQSLHVYMCMSMRCSSCSSMFQFQPNSLDSCRTIFKTKLFATYNLKFLKTELCAAELIQNYSTAVHRVFYYNQLRRFDPSVVLPPLSYDSWKVNQKGWNSISFLLSSRRQNSTFHISIYVIFDVITHYILLAHIFSRTFVQHYQTMHISFFCRILAHLFEYQIDIIFF